MQLDEASCRKLRCHCPHTRCAARVLPQERTKFERETRVNVGGRSGRSSLADKK